MMCAQRLVIVIAWLLLLLLAIGGCESRGQSVRVMSFNILQGGGDASNVGFSDDDYNGSRMDDIAQVIIASGANIVGIQEPPRGDTLLDELGSDWHRAGSIYSTYNIEPIALGNVDVARVTMTDGVSVVVVNIHWRPYPYGPYDAQESLREHGAPNDHDAFAQLILQGADKSGGARGIDETLDAIRPLIEQGEIVLLTGDFNEPSHLDWTDRAAVEGMDRWVTNPTGVPLRFKIAWAGSTALYELGMTDAYRAVHRDEVARPGITWTPTYAEGTVGRRPFGEQVLDRIDMIYFAGEGVRAVRCDVIGEDAQACEIAHPTRWPSDHRAVLAELLIRD